LGEKDMTSHDYTWTPTNFQRLRGAGGWISGSD